jgi:DNA-binding transcriptional ArsR family regulator
MPNTPDIASIAALVGDPARGRMLMRLMDGRALTATELALEAGVTPSTASSHLSRLAKAKLVSLAKQGRHRYYRIAGAEVAAALEGLMSIAPLAKVSVELGPQDEGLRRARICYDHLAGEAGVRLLEGLRARGLIQGDDGSMVLTAKGELWCETVRIDLAVLRSTRRRLCRACLDWSERRTHLAGALGAAILDRLFVLRWASRERGSRAVALSPRGEAFVESLEIGC